MQFAEKVMEDKLDDELHDLSQPLASLQCRLEIGLILGDKDALLDAVNGGLEDLRRITTVLGRMRKLVAKAKLEPAA